MKKTVDTTLRNIDKHKKGLWIDFQIVCKRKGISAVEKIRRLIQDYVERGEK